MKGKQVADAFHPHDEIADVLEEWEGKFRPNDNPEDERNEVIHGGELAEQFEKEWFGSGTCMSLILDGVEKLNPVPYMTWKTFGKWAIVLLSGVVYT